MTEQTELQQEREAPFYLSLRYKDVLTMADALLAVKAWSAEEFEARALWATEYVAEHAYQVPNLPSQADLATIRQAVLAGPAPAVHAGPAPAVQQPAAPDKSGNFLVALVRHVVTPNGKHCLNVKGGRMSVHGVTAWEEVADTVPAFEGWRDWEIGKEFTVLTMNLTAHHDGKKVLRFE